MVCAKLNRALLALKRDTGQGLQVPSRSCKGCVGVEGSLIKPPKRITVMFKNYYSGTY